jgi:hypothetical protein
VQDGICAVSGYKLLDGLQGIEDAGAGGGGEGEAFAVGEDGVALGLHLVGHGGGGGGGGWRVEGVTVYRVGEGGAVAGDEDVDGGGGVDRDALGGEGGFEVVDGELVFGGAGLGAVDLDAVGEGLGGGGGDEAGDGDQLERVPAWARVLAGRAQMDEQGD